MALVANRARILAAILLAGLAALLLASSAAAEERQGLLERATAGVQKTVETVGAAPGQVVGAAQAALPVPAEVPPVVAAAVKDTGQQAGALVAGAGAAASRATAPGREVVEPLVHGAPAPVAHVLDPSGPTAEAPRSDQRVSSQTPASHPPLASTSAPGVFPDGGAAARIAAGSSAGASGVPPASTPARLPANSLHIVSPAGADLVAPLQTPPLTVSAQAPGDGSESDAAPPAGGVSRAPAPVPGQGGGAAQALTAAGSGTALAIALLVLLLGWLACFARRLLPSADDVPDVRHLLILERPG